jgi:hypothetical protein
MRLVKVYKPQERGNRNDKPKAKTLNQASNSRVEDPSIHQTNHPTRILCQYELVLILAATPIGNLGDASPRLVEHLVNARFIAAEDTRTVFKLANALGIKINARLFSLHEHNENERLVQLVEIAKDADILVVSDAGMPTQCWLRSPFRACPPTDSASRAFCPARPATAAKLLRACAPNLAP